MQISEVQGFEALSVAPALCARLEKLGITVPTPIQDKAIPVAMEGNDLVGIAQTGTGKTLAFALPMAARLKDREIGLVLAPTRELAMQIADTYKKLDMQCVLIIGGAPMNQQTHQLRGKYSAIIATPGRLIDHLQQGTLRLDNIRILVLDEADRMLDMGFAPAIKRILDVTPSERQTLLFSATMPKEIRELANNYMIDPQRVEITPTGSTPELVEQELIFVDFADKGPMLQELLYENKGTVLVFARTRHGARKLAKAIRFDGHTAAELHADRTLAQRKAALEGFKKGVYRILVATDIAARGIDVKDISLVINYDVPENPHDYVHRIGRTGRAGASGVAITLAIPQQAGDIRDIERLLGNPLTLSARSTSMEHVARSRQAGTRTPTRPQQPRPQQPVPQQSNFEKEISEAAANDPVQQPNADPANGGSQYGRKNGGYARRDERAPQQERSQYGRNDRNGGYRGPQNGRDERPQQDRPQFGQNDRPQQDRPAYGQNGGYRGNQNRDDRPQQDRPQYGRDGQNGGYQGNQNRDDRPQQDRPQYGRDGQNGGYRGNQNRDDRPQQDRPAYGQNEQSRGSYPRPQNGRNENSGGGGRPGYGRPQNGRPPFNANNGRPPQRDDRPTPDGQSRPWRKNDVPARPDNSSAPNPGAPRPINNSGPANNPGHPAAQGKKGHRGWSGKPKFKSKPKFGR
jgi:ATP-dependent RNA helicase RhlE